MHLRTRDNLHTTKIKRWQTGYNKDSVPVHCLTVHSVSVTLKWEVR